MRTHVKRNYPPVSDELHPLVYKSIVGLTLWAVFAAWSFFDEDAYTGYLLVVVTGFFLFFMSLPAVLWVTWRRQIPEAKHGRLTFREWASSLFATWQGQLSGSEAAIQALLPIAALAVGMTSIGIVFAIIATHSAS